MLPCPACGELGIAEYSVLATLEAVGRLENEDLVIHSRCVRCGSTFARHGPDMERAQLRPPLKEPTIMLTPPWLGDLDRSEFERSWDAVASFYEQLIDDARLDPLRRLFDSLRERGFAKRLRAGQSMSSLGLSRSRIHGLRPDQSQLWLRPQADGRVAVDGRVKAAEIRFGPVEAKLTGPLLDAVERLASCPLE